jgi:hypothetical protein
VIYNIDLVAPQQLVTGDSLFSPVRSFQLIFQADGNLVLYAVDDASFSPDVDQAEYTEAIWSTSSNGKGGLRCDMQRDGNFVIYSDTACIWDTKTFGHPGAFLRCQDDGNLVVYSTDGSPLWSSNTQAGRRGNEDTLGSNPPRPPLPPPPPPPQQVWWTSDGSTPGGPSKATVFGSGFAGDECSVVVAAAGFIPQTNYQGSISKGILVTTPCANYGQKWQVQVAAMADPGVVITETFECYNP